jgi:pimeloyl-ACP methyl ester carboxylesterase
MVTIAGKESGFIEKGQGNPILFIHGYPLSKELWKPQVDGLSDTFHTIAIDLRGHGETPPINGEYSMDLLADDCLALLHSLEIKQPVILCGLSMGGYVCFAFYRRYPHLVRGLILAATRATSDSPEARANRDKAVMIAKEKGAAEIASSMLPKMFAPITYSRDQKLVNDIYVMMSNTSTEGIIGALMGMKNRPDSSPMLSSISVPTVIIHGTDDQLISLSEAQHMHDHIPGSRLVIIPGAGHLLNLEAPNSFNQAIQQTFGAKTGIIS